MRVGITDEFAEQYWLLQLLLRKKIDKQKQLFESNPHYPSLNLEKLEPHSGEIWSIRVDSKYRVLLRFTEKETALFLAVGPHDWIYRQAR